MIIFDFPRSFFDFSSKICPQGLFLSNIESSGIVSANCANFAHFSSVFNPFAPETYKNTFQEYFLYFEAFLCVFKCFCSLDGTKIMSIYTLITKPIESL
jgi:hypothetical protein